MPKTIYIDKEELKIFFNSSNSTQIGVAYEWENEDVVHIHTNKLLHSYGTATEVIFCKSKTDLPLNVNCSYTVVVTSIEGDVRLFPLLGPPLLCITRPLWYPEVQEETCQVAYANRRAEIQSRRTVSQHRKRQFLKLPQMILKPTKCCKLLILG